ncbi:hypothetical protein [Sulfurospirillum arcachonense]|uniref:hypothetical protein n=1 Tax=Sulfurospirillum arcachonense TaxID=57666 RepID=UPI0004696FAD|nr:hypothetical protein [Sulfurospirillum arcachonense]
MLEEEKPFQIEVMPKVKGLWCNFLVYILYLGLTLTPFGVGVFFWWYLHSIWIGFLFFLFALIISIVIISKMRINSIPFSQREMNYSTMAVVKWYVGKNICI